MKNYFILIVALAIFAACGNPGTPNNGDREYEKNELSVKADPAKVTTVEFAVKGMTCSGCENSVVNAVKKLDGIESVTASHKKENTIVSYDTSLVSITEIRDVITETGYKVEDI